MSPCLIIDRFNMHSRESERGFASKKLSVLAVALSLLVFCCRYLLCGCASVAISFDIWTSYIFSSSVANLRAYVYMSGVSHLIPQNQERPLLDGLQGLTVRQCMDMYIDCKGRQTLASERTYNITS